MKIREPPADTTDTIPEQLLLPSFRETEALDPSFSELDDEALHNVGCGYWLNHDDRTLFVAEIDGTAIGFISVSKAESPPIFDRGQRAHIDGLYVKDEYRREGIASQLVARVERWAENEGCTHLGVTVHKNNDAAKRLYDGQFALKFLSYRRPVRSERRGDSDSESVDRYQSG